MRALLSSSPPVAAAAASLLLFGAAVQGQANVIGTTRWSADGYVEYVIGNAPIIVSAGHGGDLEPPSMPDRSYGTTVKDTRTLELAREFADDLAERFALRPHLILFHLSRKKVDVNRDIVEGAQGHPLAEQAYLAFHQACADARARVLATWGFGCYLDLHGHGHPEGWVELGYALSANQLALPDAVLAQASYVVQSTLRSAGSAPGVWFPELLRGASSLGGHLQSGSFDSVPSPVNPDPAGGNYFSGGFNVQRYGSLDSLPVDGVQIETPWSVRRSTMVRAPFLQRVGSWLRSFFVNYRGTDPSLGGRVTVAAVDRVASETGGVGEFVVHRSGSLAQVRLVTLYWAGTATAGMDYSAPPLVAAFAPGIDEVRIPVVAIDDAVAEGEETVELWLATGNDIGVPNTAQIVIHDDEPNGQVAVEFDFESVVGGVVPDRSGNGHQGVLLPAGAGPTAVGGQVGNALAFDGLDDRVRVADFAYAPGGDFTLAFWFRTSDTAGSGFRYLVSHGGLSTPHRLGVYFDQSTGVLRTALIYANDLTDLDVLDVTRDLRDGQWHHYALVAQTAGLVRVFIDGEPETAAVFHGDSLDPAGDLVLAARADLAASTFAAVTIDEFQLWQRALSAVEVALLQQPLGNEAMVYPGSGEDLWLATGVGAAPAAGPRHDVQQAPAGSTVVASYSSPGGTFDGGVAALVGELFATGAAPQHPLLPELHLLAPVVVHGPILLQPQGGSWLVTIPAGLGGSSLMLQPVALSPFSANGLFALGAGHEIRF